MYKCRVSIESLLLNKVIMRLTLDIIVNTKPYFFYLNFFFLSLSIFYAMTVLLDAQTLLFLDTIEVRKTFSSTLHFIIIKLSMNEASRIRQITHFVNLNIFKQTKIVILFNFNANVPYLHWVRDQNNQIIETNSIQLTMGSYF